MKKNMNRREFIKLTGMGLAAISVLNCPTVLGALAAESEPVDAMVIGSGFGGAVTALRLAQNGIHTVMLERGRRWPITTEQNTFSSLKEPDGRSAWLSNVALMGEPKPIDPYIGVLELTLGKGIASLSGAGFGGGSLVYAGALYQPGRALFDQTFTGSVNYDEMDSIYYPRVRNVIKPSPIPQNILGQPEYAAAKMWQSLGNRSGLNTKLIDLGVSWDLVQKELSGESVPSVIAGEFWYGNNSGAKSSLDQNYLTQAEASGYLQVETQQEVVKIEQAADGRYIVTSNEIADNGIKIGQRKYVVKKLFIAAGSTGTSKLLVKAKAKGWLEKLDTNVGRYWGNNGDFFSNLSNLHRNIQPHRGGTVIVAIEDHNNPIAPITVECYADWRFEGNDGLIPSVGMSSAPALGHFSYNAEKDDVILNWPGSDPEINTILQAASKTYQQIADAWGVATPRAHSVKPGFGMNANPTGGVTAHPLGGVVLGRATDNIGMLKNYPGLYVCDGALVPGNTGCTNPALTIAALAERNIEQALQRDLI